MDIPTDREASMPDGETENGSVSTETFYKALLQQNESRSEMERRQNKSRGEMEQRIVGKMDGLATKQDVDKIDKRLTFQERKSNLLDGIVALMAVLAGWIFGK